MYVAILAVITSVISCVRYLNIIQISNFKKKNMINPLSYKAEILIKKDTGKSYLISLLTILMTLSFINPVYLISTISYKI